MRIVLAMTGASGAVYGLSLLEELKNHNVETHLVMSRWSKHTLLHETGKDPASASSLAHRTYDQDDMTAGPASGSFRHRGMVIAPCSMKTLAAIASGYGDNLILRAADVTIKERRPLVLVVRETPLSPIHLENMLKLARIGVVIMPPVPAFYTKPATMEDIVRHTTGRIMDVLGIENTLTSRWGE